LRPRLSDFKDAGKEIIILLCDGDKSSQKQDVMKALEIAASCKLDNKEK
jgi:putative component of toxin-antitoxin plasmid stabilization module